MEETISDYTSTYFETIPEELVIQVLLSIEEISDLLQLATCSKKMNQLCCTADLWKRRYIEDFGEPEKDPTEMNLGWKELYVCEVLGHPQQAFRFLVPLHFEVDDPGSNSRGSRNGKKKGNDRNRKHQKGSTTHVVTFRAECIDCITLRVIDQFHDYFVKEDVGMRAVSTPEQKRKRRSLSNCLESFQKWLLKCKLLNEKQKNQASIITPRKVTLVQRELSLPEIESSEEEEEEVEVEDKEKDDDSGEEIQYIPNYVPSVLSDPEDDSDEEDQGANQQSLDNTFPFALITCGNYEMRVIDEQCAFLGIERQLYFDSWINTKDCFSEQYLYRARGLDDMASRLGIQLSVKMNPTRTLSNIVTTMIQDGCVLQLNRKIT